VGHDPIADRSKKKIRTCVQAQASIVPRGFGGRRFPTFIDALSILMIMTISNIKIRDALISE